ncbi:hypothetical protein LIER_38960 [Lithospermum erythrorhizon]|uniref:Uncharacterized protein n=1 Tax=Lithospermum erythrorhizon TaxID=34254 RepID=A0AAV3Q7I4_LITER
MAVGVPYIWTLKNETRSLPTCIEADIRAVEKMRAVLPQETENTHRLPWYAFVDEAMLVLAGLVYDKEFDPEAKDDPPTWVKDEAQGVYGPFGICACCPLPPAVVPVLQVRPMLKRIANDIPASTSNPSKKTKKTVPSKKSSKVLARYSGEEETHSQGVGLKWVGPVVPKVIPQTIVVDVSFSDTLFDPGASHESSAAKPEEEVCHREGKAPNVAYDEKYLETPFQILNLEVSVNSPWHARKFHYHLTRPLFSKKVAAQYKPLRDPYATLAQSMKHIVQCRKKAFSHKNGLLKRLDTERTKLKNELEALNTTVEEHAKRVEDLSVEFAKEKEAALEAVKSWNPERANLISERDA